MSNETTLGTFALRELNSFTGTARAGARRELERLVAAAQLSLKEIERGAVPSYDLVALAAKADRWASQLTILQDVHSVLEADHDDIPADAGMHKIKVRFTGLGKPKTLTYQTARTVALGEEVEVPRWPGMAAGPPLRGTVVALTSDREGPLTTIVGG